MEKEKENRNPYILCVIVYSLITVVYVVLTIIFTYQGKIPTVILYAICTALWGVLSGVWIYKAISYKYIHRLETERLRLIHANIELSEELIMKQFKEVYTDER